MENLISLNNKRVKKIISVLSSQFGFEGDFLKKYAFFMKKKDNSFKMVTRDVAVINECNINVDSIGLRIGKEISDGILLSIDGSQIIGPYCTKNIVEISREEARKWLRGFDLNTEHKADFVILKHGGDFLGTGKVKNNKILNNIPKTRRLKCID